MCPAIYLGLIALALYYSAARLDQLALSEAVGDGQWVQVASGWAIATQLWPLLLAVMLLASGLTLFVARRLHARGGRAGEAGR